MKKILRNSAKCLKCQTEIESKSVHDFVACPCGNLMVDGGREYQRILWCDGDELSWTNTSLVSD